MLEQTLLSLPIEKKIGQLFFIGIGGGELNEDSKQLLEEISPGGVCLFARNIKTAEQTRTLLSDIRENSETDPFLSLDEEGGVVDRLRRIVTPLPAAASIKTLEDAERLAEITAEIIRTLGFNMNFAPVVDIVDSERAKFSNGLYSRAFGDSKETVVQLAGAYFKTLQNQNVIGCLKHFPGLGASAVDSHEELPLVNISEKELFETDLFPYRELFKTKKVAAVMIAHAAFPETDLQEVDSNGKLLPSSLSYNFVTKLLRGHFDFDNLIITDDLEMGAIIKNYGIGEACKLAIKVGNDMLTVCAGEQNIRIGFNAILNAVKSSEISEKRIDESLRRIARVKNSLPKNIPLNLERLQFLSNEIARLNERIESQLLEDK